MMLTRIVRMQSSFRNRFSEWMLGTIMLGTGWMFFLPEESMGSPILMQMTYTMPENAWAIVGIALGTARLFVLILNGAWRKQSHARAFLSLLHLLVWTQISIVFINFPVPSPGDVIFPVFVLAEIFITFRAAVEAGSTDAMLKNGGD